MPESKYTPGKWEAATYAGDHVVTSNGELIIECSTPHVSDRDAAANAQLIAAAPDLLDACKEAAAEVELIKSMTSGRVLEILLNAIAKAEGRGASK